MIKKDTVIEIQNLSKKYKIGKQGPYLTLRDTIVSLSKKPIKLFSKKRAENPEIWALKDVSFRVKRGEVIGIIGKNGSGKSTLLKILSRITEPTAGKAIIKGQVASLLEVGTGFNPELTGRENIYLNGAILGMSKKKINQNFDKIVKFSGISQFLDTPVKRYSSGMYVRLAFSVAAHLESEILLIDEVLAVGDTAFQKKCLGKMNETAKQGRTILFVSHNMNSIKNLCSKGILLEKGRIQKIGRIETVIDTYLRKIYQRQNKNKVRVFKENKQKPFQVMSASLLDSTKKIANSFNCDKLFIIKINCKLRKKVPSLYGYLSIAKTDGTIVFVSDSFDNGINPIGKLKKGSYQLFITIPPRTLGHGKYIINLSFSNKQTKSIVDNPGYICSFRLDDFTSRRGNRREGFFSTLLKWKINKFCNYV